MGCDRRRLVDADRDRAGGVPGARGRAPRQDALIGQDAAALQAVLADVRTPAGEVLPMARHDSLEAATRWAFEQAKTGDAVLLSPACASLDMFRNYAHRAEVFISAARALAGEAA